MGRSSCPSPVQTRFAEISMPSLQPCSFSEPQEPSLHKGEVLSEKISSYIGKNLHQGLTLKVLANSLGYSEKYCSDLFLRVMGESFSSYVRRRRIEQARLLLTTTQQTLAEISAAVGFSDQFAFSHFFKRATGYSPMRFRIHQSR